MRKFLLFCLFILFSVAINGEEVFEISVAEGIDMRFSIPDADKNEVTVAASGATAAISIHTTGDFVIPSKITYNETEYTVTGISSYAFYKCDNLTSVTIPETIKSIGNHAFDLCSETLVVKSKIQKVFDLEDYTFVNLNYFNKATLYVPVGTLAAYKDANGWKEFSVIEPDGELGVVTFSEKIGSSNEKLLYFRVLSDEDKTVEVSGYTPNDLSKVSVPSSTAHGWKVVRIGDHALSGGSLRTISLPNTIKSIGDYAFFMTSWNNISIPENVVTIGKSAFKDVYYIGKLVIPDAVKSIGEDAFSGMRITSLELGSGITDLGQKAFYNCAYLASVTIKDGVTSIGERAFERCFALNSIDIPNSVLSVGTNAFSGCSSLKTATIGTGVQAISDGMFAGCSSLTEITVSNNVKAIGGNAFGGCGFLSFEVPNTVTTIGDYAFRDCSKMVSCSLPSILTSLGRGVFSGCSSLKSISLPDCVSCIEGLLFSGCTSLESITIPEGVTRIEPTAFMGLTALKSIVLPSSISYIGPRAFSNCSSLQFIDLLRCTDLNISEVDRSDNGLTPGVFANIPASTIIYLPLGNNSVTGENIVNTNLDDIVTCGDMSVSEETGIQIPTDINVTGTLSNPRTIEAGSENVQTLCLPYDYILPQGMKAYAFNAKDDKGNLIYSEVSSIKANMPYLVVTTTTINNFDAHNVIVKATPLPMPNAGSEEFEFRGALSKIDNAMAASMGAYILKSDLKWYPITAENVDDYIASGQAYLVPKGTNPSAFIQVVLRENEYIEFVDGEVKRICVENWDTDGDGELSMDEAAAVKDLNNVFKENKTISTFNELQFFTGLKVLKYGDFGGCTNLESVILPVGLEEIESVPFDNCNALKGIIIPASVNKIGNANIGTYLWNLDSIQVEEGNTVYDSHDDSNAIIETASKKLIVGCQSTDIPNDVTTIAGWAFNTCLEKPIVIPEGVTTIEKNAFLGNHFKTIVLPSTLASMTWAFHDCSLNMVESHIMTPFDLDELTFNMANNAVLYVPKGTKELYEATAGWNQFADIIEIEEETADNIINFEDENVKQLCLGNWDVNASGEISFNEAAGVLNVERLFRQSNINSFNELQYFTRLKSIGDYTFQDSGLSSVVLPPSVESIGHGAFLACKMTEIDLPASVTSIDENAFHRCRNLTSVRVSWQEPIAIDEKAFPTRANVVLHVPAGTKALYQAADYWKEFKEIHEFIEGASGTYSIEDDNETTLTDGSELAEKEVVIPQSIAIDGEEYAVTAIGENAFANNTLMTRVTIPESVVEIGNGAFSGCSALEVIYSLNKEPIALGNAVAAARSRTADGEAVTSDVFAGVNKETCVLYVPAGSKKKYAAADGWKEFKTIKEFGGSADMPGDANSDNKVNVADIVEILNFKKGTPSEHFNEANADVNADGDVDDEDIKAIENYLMNVAPSTIGELKALVNIGGDYSNYHGWYVDGEGNISSGDANAVGRICYISTSDVDIAFAGSRILVLANTDLTEAHGVTWGVYGKYMHLNATKEPEGLCGYNNTNTLQAHGHGKALKNAAGTILEYETGYPAACYAWNHDGDKPIGASHWFLPSFTQWKNMLTTAGKSGTGQLTSGKVYWSSTDNSGNFAYFVTQSQTGDNPKSYSVNINNEEACNKTWSEWARFCARACYAY